MEKIVPFPEKNESSDIFPSGYLDVSFKASFDDSIFNSFKTNQNYTEILEHVTQYQGSQYLDMINNSLILENIEKFKINDILGNPKKYHYPKIGESSPTTLRYIKVLQDLMENFVLENSNIIEIGSGYGGQYVILRQLINPKKYSFVDLPQILPLVKTYVDKLGLTQNVEFIDSESNEFEDEYDLVISNYAISECNLETQSKYLEKILKNSKHGYITHNQFNGYTLDEFVEKLTHFGKNPVVTVEQPSTSDKNVIIIW